MIIHCNICGKPFKEEEEVRGDMDVLWHELGSKIHYSFSPPHHAIAASFRHVSCEQQED